MAGPQGGNPPRRSAAWAAVVIMSASSKMMSLKPLLSESQAIARVSPGGEGGALKRRG